jgi:hypothetical protein
VMSRPARRKPEKRRTEHDSRSRSATASSERKNTESPSLVPDPSESPASDDAASPGRGF